MRAAAVMIAGACSTPPNRNCLCGLTTVRQRAGLCARVAVRAVLRYEYFIRGVLRSWFRVAPRDAKWRCSWTGIASGSSRSSLTPEVTRWLPSRSLRIESSLLPADKAGACTSRAAAAGFAPARSRPGSLASWAMRATHASRSALCAHGLHRARERLSLRRWPDALAISATSIGGLRFAAREPAGEAARHAAPSVSTRACCFKRPQFCAISWFTSSCTPAT